MIEKRKTLNLLKGEGDDPTNYLTADEVAQIEVDYERVKDKFTKNQRSWSRLDLRSMARKVDAEKLYVSFCQWPQLQIHTTAIGLTARIAETTDAVTFKEGPSRDEADRALLGAHACLLLAIEEHVRYFRLTVDVAPLTAQYKRYWDRPASDVGGSVAAETPPAT